MSHRFSPLLSVARTRYRPPRVAFSSCDCYQGISIAHLQRRLSHCPIRLRVRLLWGVVLRHAELLVAFEHRLLVCAVPRLALRPWRPPHLFGRAICCRHCRRSMTFSLADVCGYKHVRRLNRQYGKKMQDTYSGILGFVNAAFLATKLVIATLLISRAI